MFICPLGKFCLDLNVEAQKNFHSYGMKTVSLVPILICRQKTISQRSHALHGSYHSIVVIKLFMAALC